MNEPNRVQVENLGIIDYKEAWDHQESLFKKVVAAKLHNRQLPESEQQFTGHYLLFCEHPHVVTLGKSGDEKNLLLNSEGLRQKQVAFYKINRGGDITYHGPGQLVAYPIFNLDYIFTDIHRYMRTLEEAVILTLAEYGIKGERLKGLTGVWLDAGIPAKARKICAMGVRTSHWVTMHGLALNVNTNLDYFSYIIPCGISGKAVTSIQAELGKTIPLNEVRQKLQHHILQVFELEENPAEISENRR
ncbi:MAG: lipoyl(octanoyl) transferase LipB [Bacteroidia bacterium]|jgi:lipoyl(octanoyl) transferase|nr:lipoyl(octanoyl) transferase LipB [Bacteroidia bacterium]